MALLKVIGLQIDFYFECQIKWLIICFILSSSHQQLKWNENVRD